jgi:Ran GTPase-activating protein (RanGAP) involved in mRNA processing and transport
MQNEDKENKWLQKASRDTVTFRLITDQDIKLPTLKTLQLISTFFSNYSTITRLIIRGNTINKLVIDTLMASLKQLPLTYLDLSNNKIDPDTIKVLRLNDLTRLKCLKLDQNCIGDQGIIALSSALNKVRLTELSLAMNNIQSDGIIALSTSLEKHSTLTNLSLPGNTINQAGAKGLCSVIINNPHIMVLNLSNNKLGPIEAKTLAEGFGLNTSIKTLYLSYNNIGSLGIKDLVLALSYHPALCNFHLAANNIGDEGTLSISHLVRNNTILTCLNIRSNAIGTKGGELLVSALKENKVIKNLDLSLNPLGKTSTPLLKEINELVSYNVQIASSRALKSFIYTMIILAVNPSPDSSAPSPWFLLPADIKDSIINRVCEHLSRNKQLRKSNSQLYQCARFIFDNKLTINQKIRAKEPIRILERKIETETYPFTFFKISSDSPQIASDVSTLGSLNQATTHKL